LRYGGVKCVSKFKDLGRKGGNFYEEKADGYSELEQTNKKKKEDWERMLSCLTSTRML
jgi:hypothetical protein